jgi:hypothetical protein
VGQDFKTREEWLEYRNRKPSPPKIIHYSERFYKAQNPEDPEGEPIMKRTGKTFEKK